jgi:hypothetical protein
MYWTLTTYCIEQSKFFFRVEPSFRVLHCYLFLVHRIRFAVLSIFSSEYFDANNENDMENYEKKWEREKRDEGKVRWWFTIVKESDFPPTTYVNHFISNHPFH